MPDAIDILLVEDDPDIASALTRGLAAEGLRVHHTARVEQGLALLQGPEIQAAIVDVMIGEESGLDLVRDARKLGIKKPLIMLSALADVEDRSRGIEAGANDYVVKPFAFEELFARLQVQLTREPAKPAQIALDAAQSCVTYLGEAVQLTEREFQLLEKLAAAQDAPVSRWDIYDDLWSGDSKASENIVDVYIGYLRKKLAMFSAASGPEIQTIRNKGFKIKLPQ